MNLSQKYAELLDSRLRAWNLLHQDTEICFFHNRQNALKEFFSQENDLVFCNDICCVTEAAGHHHSRAERRLFIDSFKFNLKVVLLNKGNKFPSVPLAHAANVEESYEI
jgi:hypothetical protein